MPAHRNREPTLTPKYLLDRLDYQLYSASAALKRLKIAFGADSQDFKIDAQKEIRELERRFQTLRRHLRQLAALPK
jgi:hypothetical protein